MKTLLLSPTPAALATAARSLLAGEIGGVPTETVYGLAGLVDQPEALAKIFEAKERPTFDPLIVHVGPLCNSVAALADAGLVDASKMNDTQRDWANRLITHFWPGPLTLVLPKHAEVSDLITSGLPTVALRMPKHPIAQALLAFTETAFAAPSANRFGRISPTRAEHVVSELDGRIPWVLDGGPCMIGVESTILNLTVDGRVELLRAGGTPLAELEAIIQQKIHFASLELVQPSAPGMLESHYAPEKPLFLVSIGAELTGSYALIKVLGPLVTSLPHQATLSARGQIREAAQNLFQVLREMDQAPVEKIYVELPSDRGWAEKSLGHAIADRLKKASHRRGGS